MTNLDRMSPEDPERISPRQWLLTCAFTLLLGAFALWFFETGIERNFEWDLGMHAVMTAIGNRLGVTQGHFLYSLLLSLLSGFSTRPVEILRVAPIVLAIAVAARMPLTAWVVHRLGAGAISGDARRSRWWIPSAVALGVAISFSLPFPDLYPGQFPANTWHNPTAILVTPLALALFWVSLRYLREPSRAGIAWMLALIGLNLAAKPSFVICFLPAYPLLLWFRDIDFKWKIYGLAVVVAGGLGLMGQYFWIFESEGYDQIRQIIKANLNIYDERSEGVALAPLRVWSAWTTSIPLSLLSSLAFPLAAIAARARDAWRDLALRYAWLLFGIGLAAYSLLIERGHRAFDANFSWQVILCMYVLFAASAAMLLRPSPNARPVRTALAWLVFGAHVTSGIYALSVMIRTGTYFRY